jgi:hypothetical protein
MKDVIDDPRRDFLVKALSMGLFASTAGGLALPVWAMGKIPNVIPPGKSIFDLKGKVTVNDVPASLNTFINSGDIIKTGNNSHVVFVVSKDAFILRDNSSMEISGAEVINTIRVFSGKVLSVFGKRETADKLSVRSATATIGIRGTGVYMEADPERTYLCTCYGMADIVSTVDKNANERITAMHHDSPRYILARSEMGGLIHPAPMINHTDMELELIEELVGRKTPFGIAEDLYTGPRKEY